MDLEKIASPIRSELEAFEAAFTALLHSDVPLVEHVVRYIASHKGKRLRPILVFLCARLFGKANQRTISAALIVEMLHTATLVHDDVVDESDLRRGSPTVNNLWNNKVSVLVGDFIFSKTLSSMVKLGDLDALAILSCTAEKITEGELLQIERDHDFEMNETIYFDLVSKKTASLFSAACELGVLTVRNDAQERAKLRNFGHALGIAFQIRDDLLDYTGDSVRLGKPTANDIRENKVTLPLIFSLGAADAKARAHIINLFETGVQEEQEIRAVIEFVRDLGGVEYSHNMARRYAQRALHELNGFSENGSAASLRTLVNFAIQRDS